MLDQHPGDPQSWNLYSYVRNNPLTFVDPSGNDCIYTNNFNSNGTVGIERGNCSQSGGTYVAGTIDINSLSYDANSHSLDYGYTAYQGGTASVGSTGLPDPGIEALQRGTRLAEPGVNLAAAGTAAVMGGAFIGMAYGAWVGGEIGALGLEMLPSQARNIQAIENAIANHVRMSDLAGAAKETAGFAIRSGGKVWNHRQELIETARNLRGAVRALRGSLNDPSHGGATRQVVQQAIQKAETALRQIDAALRR